jgi:predicted Zn finger-like uncharacterized protein
MKIRCPHCQAELKVREDLRGKQARCPRCRKELHLEPETASERNGSPQDEFADVEPLNLVAASQRRKKQEAESPDGETGEDGAADETPRRRRRIPRSTWGMLVGVVAAPFWRSALLHLPYLTAGLACAGALLGIFVILVKNALAAGLVFYYIGIPTAILVYFLMCYPTSCFFKVVVGSADSSRDIDEWPESNFGEWVFELLMVAYMIVLTLMLSTGVAKLRQSVFPGQLPSGAYWQLTAAENAEEGNDTGPGPGWPTTFVAFTALFPLVVITCVEPTTAILVPWSPRVFFSLLKNFPAWLVVFIISAAMFCGAAAILYLGAGYAPFLTFTLCSPLAAVGLLFYGRVLGRLLWLIART